MELDLQGFARTAALSFWASFSVTFSTLYVFISFSLLFPLEYCAATGGWIVVSVDFELVSIDKVEV